MRAQTRTVRVPMIALASILLFGCAMPSGSNAAEDVYAFANVDIVPMDSPRVVNDQTVIVRGSRIAEVGPVSQVTIPDGAVVIDGHGKYLMPGLADMHVHLRDPTALPLFTANGVTTVRNMWGNPSVLKWRKEVEEGSRVGPRIFTTGPILDGVPQYWSGSVGLETPAAAREEVKAEKAAGYDAIKVMANMSPDVYAAVLDAAQEQGLSVYGHVPTRVGLDAALGMGQRSFEHMIDFMYALLPTDSPVRAEVVATWEDRTKSNPKSLFIRPYASADKQKIAPLVDRAVEAGVWFCPALIQQQKLASTPEQFTALQVAPIMQYASPDDVKFWTRLATVFSSDMGDPVVMQRGVRTMLDAVGLMHERGVGLLIGTDTPNPFVVPGFSVHEELANFVEAGLTPFEALATATRDAAKFLEASEQFGTVQVGRKADLLLLEENPLEDVRHVSEPKGVMANGRWFSQADLHSLLETVATEYRETAANPPDPNGQN